MKHSEAVEHARKWFSDHGFKVYFATDNDFANGPDMVVLSKNDALRVEVKPVRKTQKGSWQAEPIARTSDDFVCVVFPTGHCFVELMGEYLECCPESRIRSFTRMLSNLG